MMMFCESAMPGAGCSAHDLGSMTMGGNPGSGCNAGSKPPNVGHPPPAAPSAGAGDEGEGGGEEAEMLSSAAVRESESGDQYTGVSARADCGSRSPLPHA